MKATRPLVVLLPWQPATQTPVLPSISRATMSARLITGMPRRRASFSSGLSPIAAEVVTTRLGVTDVGGVVRSDDDAGAEPLKRLRQCATRRRSEPDIVVTPAQQNAADRRHVHAADADKVDVTRDLFAHAATFALGAGHLGDEVDEVVRSIWPREPRQSRFHALTPVPISEQALG